VRSPPCVGLPCASPRLPLDRVRERRANAHTTAARASRLTRVVKRAEPALRCVSEGREAGGRDGGETAAAQARRAPRLRKSRTSCSTRPCRADGCGRHRTAEAGGSKAAARSTTPERRRGRAGQRNSTLNGPERSRQVMHEAHGVHARCRAAVLLR
jgi:hypothetical protein